MFWILILKKLEVRIFRTLIKTPIYKKSWHKFILNSDKCYTIAIFLRFGLSEPSKNFKNKIFIYVTFINT